ncbi:MAG: DNA polymerase IV [Actinomycetota bacterium]|nr:DNA polymerase IV [Actinomycetota bacterium]
MTVDVPILHVDMDAFYAAVETIKDPSLVGRPVVVGGMGNRGVVTSASYEARTFGVKSAMPIVTARRLCPHAAYLPNDFTAYQDYSHRIQEVFLSYSPLVEPLSLDEAFIDVSGSIKLFGDPVTIAKAIKKDVSAIGLTCTVGVGYSKFIAKLASARAKPDGLLKVGQSEIESWLHPLPVTALWGVGEQTAEALRRLGLKTVGDVARLSKRTLERSLGNAVGAHLHELANGIDDRQVTPYEPAKSVGSENTYEHDLDNEDDVLREVLRLAERTAGRLRAKRLCARTVTLKIRFSNFKTITRSKTLAEATASGTELYEVARDLYLRLSPERPRIRLLGVAGTGLVPGPPKRQLDLLGAGDVTTKRDEVTRAVDDIRVRFGETALSPAALLDPE